MHSNNWRWWKNYYFSHNLNIATINSVLEADYPAIYDYRSKKFSACTEAADLPVYLKIFHQLGKMKNLMLTEFLALYLRAGNTSHNSQLGIFTVGASVLCTSAGNMGSLCQMVTLSSQLKTLTTQSFFEYIWIKSWHGQKTLRYCGPEKRTCTICRGRRRQLGVMSKHFRFSLWRCSKKLQTTLKIFTSYSIAILQPGHPKLAEIQQSRRWQQSSAGRCCATILAVHAGKYSVMLIRGKDTATPRRYIKTFRAK